MSYLHQIETVRDLLDNDDHFDVKTIEGDVTLREFIVGMLSYHPKWIKALYGIRAGFVRLLGMKQANIHFAQITPQSLSFTKGKGKTFFHVVDAKENDYWIGKASDKHLDAYIVVAQEQLVDGTSRFHVGTIVHYKNWAGPVYFNVIRPFHHIVVASMMQAGTAYQPAQGEYTYA